MTNENSVEEVADKWIDETFAGNFLVIRKDVIRLIAAEREAAATEMKERIATEFDNIDHAWVAAMIRHLPLQKCNPPSLLSKFKGIIDSWMK
jgi:hypothetical protein